MFPYRKGQQIVYRGQSFSIVRVCLVCVGVRVLSVERVHLTLTSIKFLDFLVTGTIQKQYFNV